MNHHRKAAVFCVFVAGCQSGSAPQVADPGPAPQKSVESVETAPICAADDIGDRIRAREPQAAPLRQHIDDFFRAKAELAAGQAKTNQVKKEPPIQNAGSGGCIPVVVHIVHDPADATPGAGSNVGDAQVRRAIGWLNEGFSNTGSFQSSEPYAADTQISFCLAATDPAGNPTSGITRTADPNYASIEVTTEDVDQATSFKGQIPAASGGVPAGAWDQKTYMNIWVVDEICSQDIAVVNGGNGCVVNGYATMADRHGLWNDGIVMDRANFGVTPEDTYPLLHESGHYLDLFHTFNGHATVNGWSFVCAENNCATENDWVCDTPLDGTANPSPGYPCNATVTGCSTTPELMDNFMDYGTPGCMRSFTAGQGERMRDALTNFRGTLLAPTPPVGCSSGPFCDITAAWSSAVDLNNSLDVAFTSQNTQTTATYAWTFGDGQTSSAASPTHGYDAAGVYEACLTVSDNCGTETVCHDVTVIVPFQCYCPQGAATSNLVAFGDFENVPNPVPFTTSLAVGAGPARYVIGQTMHDKYPAWPTTYVAHTGSAMLIDGPNPIDISGMTNPSSVIWQQSGIPVVAGNDYTFSFWFDYWLENNWFGRPEFRLEVDDGTTNHILLDVTKHELLSQQWMSICSHFIASATGNVTLRIRQIDLSHINGGGADHYSIDDIFFGTCACDVTADFTAPPVCEGDAVSFPNTSQNGATFDWRVDGAPAGSTSDLVQVFTPGSHTVGLVAANGSCSDSQSTTIQVQSAIDATFAMNPSGTVCLGDAISLSYGGQGVNKFFVDNQFLGAGNVTWTPTQTGIYWVSNVAKDDACADNRGQAVEIKCCSADCSGDPPKDVGACCTKDGSCFDGMTPAYCQEKSGSYLGNGTSCATEGALCKAEEPKGACCLDSGCAERTAAECQALNGSFAGAGSVCNEATCPGCTTNEPVGACCVEGQCLVLSAGACFLNDGLYAGDGSVCTSGKCDCESGCCDEIAEGCSMTTGESPRGGPFFAMAALSAAFFARRRRSIKNATR